VAGRASIVGAAETNVGKVRNHNEDSHFLDPDQGIFLVCDGMGGHAAGEVASALAVQTIRENWMSRSTQQVAEAWLAQGTPDAHKTMITAIREGAQAAHTAILDEANRDRTKGGMGTTLVGAMVVGADMVFAHCGDSRAYLVRDGIAVQLTEDHTLLARLLAAGVDVDVEGDGSRFKSMLTNALGIGQECKVSTFVVPLADGDRFLLCSDGITEYLKEAEIGEVLCKQPSPARAAQRLVEIALERGGGDNATALVVRVLEAGETSRPSEMLRKEQEAIASCALWRKLTSQQRLRGLRIALPREHAAGEKIPALTLGDRVAWIVVDGDIEQDGTVRGPGALLYPEALLADRPLPDREGLASARSDVRALALRADDFHELCEDDPEIGEALLAALGAEIAARAKSGPPRKTGKIAAQAEPEAPEVVDAKATTDPGAPARAPTDPSPAHGVPKAAPAQITRPFGSRASTQPLILQKEEQAAAAADLEDALSKVTLDDGWGELDDEPAPPPAPAKPRAVRVDQSEPEISILPSDTDTESDGEAAEAAAAAASAPPPEVVEMEAEPPPEVEAPPPDAPGEEPEEMVLTTEEDEDAAKPVDAAAPVAEILKESSSEEILLVVDE
jgi:serine/threonine protein phosphatase PrpC